MVAKSKYNCVDCKEPEPFIYMVTSLVWRAYGAGRSILCWTCLEKRIGRELENYDLSDAPCNKLYWKGFLKAKNGS